MLGTGWAAIEFAQSYLNRALNGTSGVIRTVADAMVGTAQDSMHQWLNVTLIAGGGLVVVGVIDKGAEKDAVRARKLAQDVEGAQLVALVGRIGDAVHQVQNRRQRASRIKHHPSPGGARCAARSHWPRPAAGASTGR